MNNTILMIETLMKAVNGDLSHEELLNVKLHFKIEIDRAIVNEQSTHELVQYLEVLEDAYNMNLNEPEDIFNNDSTSFKKEQKENLCSLKDLNLTDFSLN